MATTEELLDLDPTAGIAQRQVWFSFDLLDLAGVKIGEVHPDEDSTMVISHDATNAVMRSMDGFRLGHEESDGFDERGARIRPWMHLENGATFALGTFKFAGAARERSSIGVEFHGRMADLSSLLAKPIMETYSLRRGALISQAIEHLLEEAGFVDHWVEPMGVQVGTEVGWRGSESRLGIINELAALQGCLPVVMTPLGQPRVEPPPDPATATPTVVYRAGWNILANPILETNDLLSAPNVFIVRETGAQATPIQGRYELPASAPNSYTRLGEWNPLFSDEQGLQSVAAANERARVLSLTDGTVLEYASFDGPLDPRHAQVGVAVVEFLGVTYLERQWRMPLNDRGDMAHSLAKFYGED